MYNVQIYNNRAQFRTLAKVYPRVIINGRYLRKMKQSGAILGFSINEETGEELYLNFGSSYRSETIKVWIDSKANPNKETVKIYEISNYAFSVFIGSCDDIYTVKNVLKKFIGNLSIENDKVVKFKQAEKEFNKQISLAGKTVNNKKEEMVVAQKAFTLASEDLEKDREYLKLLEQQKVIENKIAQKEKNMLSCKEKLQSKQEENKVLNLFIESLKRNDDYSMRYKMSVVRDFLLKHKDFKQFLSDSGIDVDFLLKHH